MYGDGCIIVVKTLGSARNGLIVIIVMWDKSLQRGLITSTKWIGASVFCGRFVLSHLEEQIHILVVIVTREC